MNKMLSGLLVTCAALALPIQVLALPTTDGRTCSRPYAEYVNAHFDDITAIPGTQITPVPTPYRGLFFQAYRVVSVIQTNLLPGVIPHSPKQYAAANALTQTTSGTAMLTTNYPNSNTTGFALESFYFGCSLDLQNGAAAAPTACNIEVTTYRGNDNQVSAANQLCSQQFQYNPSTSTGPQQQAFSGRVDGCFQREDARFAIVTFSLPGGTSLLSGNLVMLLDDVKYKYSYC